MKSIQSNFVLILGIIVIILSLIKYMNFKLVLIQAFVFYMLASDIECKIYGGCHLSSWIALIIPLTLTTIFVLDYLKYFKTTKEKVKKIYGKIELLKSTELENIVK